MPAVALKTSSCWSMLDLSTKEWSTLRTEWTFQTCSHITYLMHTYSKWHNKCVTKLMFQYPTNIAKNCTSKNNLHATITYVWTMYTFGFIRKASSSSSFFLATLQRYWLNDWNYKNTQWASQHPLNSILVSISPHIHESVLKNSQLSLCNSSKSTHV